MMMFDNDASQMYDDGKYDDNYQYDDDDDDDDEIKDDDDDDNDDVDYNLFLLSIQLNY